RARRRTRRRGRAMTSAAAARTLAALPRRVASPRALVYRRGPAPMIRGTLMRDSISLRRLIPRALLALGVLLALAGCSQDRDVLIRIGPRVVTVDDFKAAARGSQGQYLGSPETAKAELF